MGVDISHIVRHDFGQVENWLASMAFVDKTMELLKKKLNLRRDSNRRLWWSLLSGRSAQARSTGEAPRERVSGFEGLRVVAMCMVVLLHLDGAAVELPAQVGSCSGCITVVVTTQICAAIVG